MANLDNSNFDSRQYEWNDLNVLVGGKLMIGITGLSYTIRQDKKAIYGKGNKPVAIQRGNKSYDGTITLLQSEAEAINRSGGKDGILGVVCNIVASYGNPSKGDMVKTDILKGVEFTEMPRDLKQGDDHMEVAIPFVFVDIVSK